MRNYTTIKETAYRLLKPNETLDVRLFDFSGRMRPEVRQHLLTNAFYIINQTVAEIEGLVIHDIFLTGSASGYFYQDSSDIDMRIEIHNQNCPYISQDTHKLNKFLSTILKGTLEDFKFCLGRRFVDTSFTSNTFELMSLYSILNNKWVITPDQHITDNLEIDDIMAEFNRRYSQLKQILDETANNLHQPSKEQIQRLSECYSNLFRDNNANIRNYIVYKLLGYSGITFEIRRVLSDASREYYSIK